MSGRPPTLLIMRKICAARFTASCPLISDLNLIEKLNMFMYLDLFTILFHILYGASLNALKTERWLLIQDQNKSNTTCSPL